MNILHIIPHHDSATAKHGEVHRPLKNIIVNCGLKFCNPFILFIITISIFYCNYNKPELFQKVSQALKQWSTTLAPLFTYCIRLTLALNVYKNLDFTSPHPSTKFLTKSTMSYKMKIFCSWSWSTNLEIP